MIREDLLRSFLVTQSSSQLEASHTASTIHVAATQHWDGKAPSLSNPRWLKRALGAAQKQDRSISRQALQKRDMPPPSLGEFYRASEMLPPLEAQPGKVRHAPEVARGWFASASAAQKINARASLGQS